MIKYALLKSKDSFVLEKIVATMTDIDDSVHQQFSSLIREDRLTATDPDLSQLLFESLGVNYALITHVQDTQPDRFNLMVQGDTVTLVIESKHQISLDKVYLNSLSPP